MKRYVDIETYDGIKKNFKKKEELDVLCLQKTKPDVPYYIIEIKVLKTEKLYAHERKGKGVK